MAQTHPIIEAGMTAVITGTSGGIGEQFARQLAQRGVHEVLVARNGPRLEELATELRGRDGALDVAVYPADLAGAGSTSELAGQLREDGITVDILINNAGVGSHDLFVDQGLDAICREIQLNCGSLVALTRALLPDMILRRRGGIINVSSTAGFQPIPSMAVYAASKAFVLSFTEALWSETKPAGIRVMAVCPGPTETGFGQAIPDSRASIGGAGGSCGASKLRHVSARERCAGCGQPDPRERLSIPASGGDPPHG